MRTTLSTIAAVLAALALNAPAQNGSLDAGFQAEVNAPVRAIAVQPDGRIVIGGDFTSVNGVPRNGVARLKTDGDLDLSFNPGLGAGGGGSVNTLGLQVDGKVLIGGGFVTFDGTNRGRIAQLNSNGGLDLSFDPGSGANGEVTALAVQTNGQIVIAGDFTSVNTSNRSRVARLNANGSLDTSFATSSIGGVRCLALQPDGRVLIGGFFSSIGGTPRSQIARLRGDGSLDISFYPASAPNSPVWSVALQNDGKILITGLFWDFGSTYYGIARLHGDGSLDVGFNHPYVNNNVFSMVVQPDAKIILGGWFSTVDGTARTGVARLNPDGTLDSTFAPGLDRPSVYSLALQPDGKALLGGDFTRVNGLARVRIARLNPDVTAPVGNLSVQMYAGLSVVGQIGANYRIEYTGNLTNQTLWRTLSDLSLTNSPQFFFDATSPFSTRRFYRAVPLP